MILYNKKSLYNKAGIGYQPNNNAMTFMHTCLDKIKRVALFINAINLINLGKLSLIILAKCII